MINVFYSIRPKTLTEILGLKYDETMTYEERVQKRYDYIKQQYELDPNYEGWDYLEYVRNDPSGDIKSLDYLVNTRGKIITLKKRLFLKVMTPFKDKDGYKVLNITLSTGKSNISLHRTVASTFIPGCTTDKKLVVNHKDLNKLNNHFTNLEWCTVRENVRHGWVNNNVSNKEIHFNKSFKATVVLDCFLKGFEFGVKDLHRADFLTMNNVRNITAGAGIVLGCKWEMIKKNDLTKLPTIPAFLLTKIANKDPYLYTRTKPIKCIVTQKGKYENFVFALLGFKEVLSNGFHRCNITSAIKSKCVVPGYKFEYISRDEAERLPRGLTKEQMEYLGLKSKYKQNKHV